jgi:hypothetical protein
MRKNLKLVWAVSSMAALLLVFPVARTVEANRAAGVEASRGSNPAEEAKRRHKQDAAKFATNAAYFDGVFQGELSISQDLDRRAPLGRWAAAADKAAFAHGYRDGYEQALAENKLPLPVQWSLRNTASATLWTPRAARRAPTPREPARSM